MRRAKCVCSVALILASLALPLLAAAPPDIIRDAADLPPPALTWALPDKAPAIRALVICPWGATRDVYELAAHMKLKFDLIETANGAEINLSEDMSGRMDQLERMHTDRKIVPALKQDYDVIILASFNLGSLSGEMKYHLLKQVTGGAGLVLTNQDWAALGDLYQPLTASSLGDGSSLVRGIPWRIFCQLSTTTITPYPLVRYQGDTETSLSYLFPTDGRVDAVVGRYQVRDGRVATLTYHAPRIRTHGPSLSPSLAYPLDRLLQHQYFLSAAAKQVRWAARGDPETAIWEVRPADTKVARGPELQDGASVVVRCNAAARGPAEVRVVVRNWDGRFEHDATQEVELTESPQTIPVPLPPLPTGEHFLDVQLLRGGSVADWGSSHLT
ncbi:MAG: hypothetical protein ACE5JM_14610, partial [Armatimonadota bacterium]